MKLEIGMFGYWHIKEKYSNHDSRGKESIVTNNIKVLSELHSIRIDERGKFVKLSALSNEYKVTDIVGFLRVDIPSVKMEV